MKVFENLDREQAAMYRWMRKHMTPSMFMHLTGKTAPEDLQALQVDRELREAFENEAYRAVMDVIPERSKIRQGLLPPALGAAILKYTECVQYDALFCESFSGETYGDVQAKVTEAFKEMCNEMAKLR